MSRTVDVAALLDFSAYTTYQKLLTTLAALAVIFDGFDIQILGFAVPSLVRDWHVARSAFGPVLISRSTISAACSESWNRYPPGWPNSKDLDPGRSPPADFAGKRNPPFRVNWDAARMTGAGPSRSPRLAYAAGISRLPTETSAIRPCARVTSVAETTMLYGTA